MAKKQQDEALEMATTIIVRLNRIADVFDDDEDDDRCILTALNI